MYTANYKGKSVSNYVCKYTAVKELCNLLFLYFPLVRPLNFYLTKSWPKLVVQQSKKSFHTSNKKLKEEHEQEK